LDPQTLEVLVLAVAIGIQAVYLFAYSERGILAIAGLAVALIVGLLAQSLTGGLVNPALSVYFPAYTYTFTLGPVVEETAQIVLLLAVLIPLNKRWGGRAGNPLSLSNAQMGMATGTFFMLFERILKDFPNGFTFPLGMIDEAPVHAVATGISAYGVGGTSCRQLRYLVPLAILVHASWNLLASLSVRSGTGTLYLAQGTAFVFMWAGFLYLGRRFRPL
jgi:hypothetical protein